MAPSTKRWIDKKSASNFQIRYRSQQDPLIHDSTATDFVFTPITAPNKKVKNATQLTEELGASVTSVRANEGEAAMYGIYYDDTSYDYMQHLRDTGLVEAVFIDAKQGKEKKGKLNLADALEDALIPKELLPSEMLLKRSYQDQQDVPDVIAGFKPDMDPRLREVLEALEDEAYVDDDEDIFGELAKGGEATEGEFEDTFFDEGGWESDATERPVTHQKTNVAFNTEEASGVASDPAEKENAEPWMSEFSKFKKSEKRRKKVDDASSMTDTMSFGGTSSLGGTMSMSGRTRRRHKKAGTESSGYSMTSSSLFRTEGLTTLDARFDKIEEEYTENSEEEDTPDGPVPETRKDFNSIMDEFLEGYNVVGRANRVRKGKTLTGLEQLDEIRQGLGKARISEKPKKVKQGQGSSRRWG